MYRAENRSDETASTGRHLCLVGNMLGRNANYITTQGLILADLFSADGYKITCVSSKINRAARLGEIVQTIIRGRENFDIVILDTYSGLSFVIADVVGSLCRLFGLPLVMVLRGGNLPVFVEKHPRWSRRVLKRADVLVAPSQFLADEIKDTDTEISVITNVIDLTNYPYRGRSKISPNLIWMRSFHPIYNPEMAVAVLAELRQSEPGATLTMAGADKGLEEKVKKMVGELGLSEAVRFAGFLDLGKKIEEFSKADIYLNTNRVDNMPVSVVEARALGLPVVATDVGGLSYLINHGEDGLLVPSEDVGAMVENIKLLLADPELARKISQKGRRLAEQSAWTSVRAEWEKLFRKVIDRQGDGVREIDNKLKTENLSN